MDGYQDTRRLLLAQLFSVFNREGDILVSRAYDSAIDDLPIESITHAAKRAIRECEWMPAPAVLRRFAIEHRRSKQRTIDERLVESANVDSGLTDEDNRRFREQIRVKFPKFNLPPMETI